MKRLSLEDATRFEPHLRECRSCAELVDLADELVALFCDASQGFELQPAEVVALEAARR